MLGKAGPVFAAADDQKFRRCTWPNLTLIAYQDEDSLINDLTSGQCDAALISGSRALSFNRFSGTLEALAVFLMQHLQIVTLRWWPAREKMAGRLGAGRRLCGARVAPCENYAFIPAIARCINSQMAGKDLLVPDTMVTESAQQLKAKARTGGLLNSADQFVSGQAEYDAGTVGGLPWRGRESEAGAWAFLEYAATVHQLIGRSERFPVGLRRFCVKRFRLSSTIT